MCKIVILSFFLLVLLGLLNKKLLRILAICLIALLIYKEFYYCYNRASGQKTCFWCHLQQACGLKDKPKEVVPSKEISENKN